MRRATYALALLGTLAAIAGCGSSEGKTAKHTTSTSTESAVKEQALYACEQQKVREGETPALAQAACQR
jgi:hypothetical protein